jgi:LPXTG-site transpeptidase (sortase) family protein
LYKLKVGDLVEVQQGGEWKSYTVTESRAVKPTDIDAILSPNNQLTLFTCEGSFDQKRRVVYAVPQ